MLPKISQKQCLKEIVPYHTFTRDIMRRKTSQNNISKLKMLKQFLDEEQHDEYALKVEYRPKANHEAYTRKSMQKQPLRPKKMNEQNQYQPKSSKVRRQSLTAQIGSGSCQIQEKSPVPQKQKSIFAFPQRFKLNQLLFNGQNRHKKPMVKDILCNSIKMNNKLHTHRIL